MNKKEYPGFPFDPIYVSIVKTHAVFFSRNQGHIVTTENIGCEMSDSKHTFLLCVHDSSNYARLLTEPSPSAGLMLLLMPLGSKITKKP